MDTKILVGRNFEQAQMQEVLTDPESKIIVMYGRRRVGKTTLLESSLSSRKYIKIEGLEGQDLKAQFEVALEQLAKKVKIPELNKIKLKNWREFYQLLPRYIPQYFEIIYFEEVQWLANYQTAMISDLKYVWDNELQKIPGLQLILCGSSPSFMIAKVLQSKSLYNRSQVEIALRPFSFAETREYLGKSKSIFEVLDAHLLVGGIPLYLKELKKKSSVLLGLAHAAFLPKAFFVNEINRIFTSSLDKNPDYRRIIEYLIKSPNHNLQEIAEALKIKKGGTLSNLIQDLEMSGFIKGYNSILGKEKSKLLRYRISDAYLHFYYKFIGPQLNLINEGVFRDNPIQAIEQKKLAIFLGYAFERFCLDNFPLIAKILGFSSVSYKVGPYYNREYKAQIDLAYERADKVLTLCEIKYHKQLVTQKVIKEMEEKIEKLKLDPEKVSIQKVLITVHGAEKSVTDAGYFTQIVTLEDIVRAGN